MSSELHITYTMECADCGEELECEIMGAYNVVKIMPCRTCGAKEAEKYKENLREKVIALMLRDEAYSPALSDKVITCMDNEEP